MKDSILFLSSEFFGQGSSELGKVLMQAFLFKLVESDVRPDEILLYNSGVKLIQKRAKTAQDFERLVHLGVKVKSCGTCLSFYHISSEEIIGQVTNMEYMVQQMLSEKKVIKP